jgi:hypothetical protein
MEFDRSLLRVAGIATILSFALQAWAVYRIENPKEPPTITQTSEIAKPGATPDGGHVNPMPPLWTVLALPVLSTGMILAAIIVAYRRRSSGLTIEHAKWYCTVYPKYFEDVTKRVQAMVIGKDQLELSAHQDDGWGDICMRHGGQGHHKNLDVTVSYHSTITIPYDKTQLIGIVRQDFDRIDRRHQLANPEPNWKSKATHFRTELERASTERDAAIEYRKQLSRELEASRGTVEAQLRELDSLSAELKSHQQAGSPENTNRSVAAGRPQGVGGLQINQGRRRV